MTVRYVPVRLQSSAQHLSSPRRPLLLFQSSNWRFHIPRRCNGAHSICQYRSGQWPFSSDRVCFLSPLVVLYLALNIVYQQHTLRHSSVCASPLPPPSLLSTPNICKCHSNKLEREKEHSVRVLVRSVNLHAGPNPVGRTADSLSMFFAVSRQQCLFIIEFAIWWLSLCTGKFQSDMDPITRGHISGLSGRSLVLHRNQSFRC